MLFLNEYEVERAYVRFSRDTDLPNLRRASIVLYDLVQWANNNSDGWAYWPKPCRAAARLQSLLQAADREIDPDDAPLCDLTSALAPVKGFLTRQGVDRDEFSPWL